MNKYLCDALHNNIWIRDLNIHQNLLVTSASNFWTNDNKSSNIHLAPNSEDHKWAYVLNLEMLVTWKITSMK